MAKPDVITPIDPARFDEQPLNIAVVSSRFNQKITQALHQGVMDRWNHYFPQTDDHQIQTRWVPGALELPLAIQTWLLDEPCDGVIALGAVIRGETSHYDLVCTHTFQGCQQVSLQLETPVMMGLLTTENEAQAWSRLGGEHGHRGSDVLDAVLEMVLLQRHSHESRA